MRKILSMSDADEILDKYYPMISSSISEGFNDYLLVTKCLSQEGRQIDFRPRTIASLVHDFIKSHVKEKFLGIEGIEARDFNEVFGLSINRKLFIRFKKLNPDFSTSNIPTRQTLALNYQQTLEGFPDEPTFIIAGYMPNATWTSITNIYLLCNEGERVLWMKDLNNIQIEQKSFEFIDQEEKAVTKLVRAKLPLLETGTDSK